MEKNFDNAYKNLGATLKRLRTEKGITQVELGNLIDKNQSTIARLESTGGYDATLRTLHELIVPLNIPLSELFAEVEGKSISKLSHATPNQSKKWESIVNKIQNMDDKSRLWTLKLIEYILERPLDK